jgi:hypothetical protein
LFNLAAKRAPGCVAGVVGAHALRDESIFQQSKVRADFARQLGLGSSRSEKRQQP